jgi:hypothetical protein
MKQEIKRRGFLGWAIASVGGAVAVGGLKSADTPKQPKVLKVRRCPTCGYWLFLPVEVKSPKTKYYDRILPIKCECPECGYNVTENVACAVAPRII